MKSAGHVIVGGVVSSTVTVNWHDTRVVAMVALHVTFVSPTGKELPDAGAQVTVAPPQTVGFV